MGLWDKVKNLLVWGDCEIKGKLTAPNFTGAPLGNSVVTEQTDGQASTAGGATEASRRDHTHGTPPASPSVIMFGGCYSGEVGPDIAPADMPASAQADGWLLAPGT
jgi:hypothetical protein